MLVSIADETLGRARLTDDLDRVGDLHDARQSLWTQRELEQSWLV